MFAFGETVTFEAVSSSSRDSHGNKVVTYLPGVSVDGWAFDPGGSVESYEPGRNRVVSSPQLFRQATDFVPGPRDRCTVRGVLYQVSGQPAVWKHPMTGWEAGVAVALEVVDG